MGDLTHRQHAFVNAYLGGPEGIRGNATQAAITAGYSRRRAAETGYRLVRNGQIQEAIQRALGESGLTRQAVLEQLRRMAFATLAEVATYDAERGLVLKPDALSHPALESVQRSFDAE